MDWLVTDALAPIPNDLTAPFFEGCAEGRLALPICGSCAQPLWFEQLVCSTCASTQRTWIDAALCGEIHALTIVHRRQADVIVATVPYLVVDVELDTSHHLTMSTVEPSIEGFKICDRVEIGFRNIGGVAVPAILGIEKEDTSS